MRNDNIKGSDLPLIKPRHVAVYHFLFVWFVKLGREILRYGDLQDIVHIRGWVHNNILKDKFQQVVHILCTNKNNNLLLFSAYSEVVLLT